MATIQRKVSHHLNKPMFGYFTPKSAADASALRGHFVAASGEFVGTYLFLFTAYLGHAMSVVSAPESAPGGANSNQTVVFIALSYGFSLLIAAWILYRVSGGLFNPAITLGMVITGTLPPWRGLVLLPAQLLGAMCAAAVVSVIIPSDINITQTTLAPDVNIAQGLFLEMFLTAHLMFTILMLAAEKSKDTFIAPIGIGLSLFICEIAGVNYTGASLNPARSFGPCVAGKSFPGYHWIYWLGPVMGACVAAGFYHFVKFFNYEDANPGQDSSGGDFGGVSDDEGKGSGGGGGGEGEWEGEGEYVALIERWVGGVLLRWISKTLLLLLLLKKKITMTNDDDDFMNS